MHTYLKVLSQKYKLIMLYLLLTLYIAINPVLKIISIIINNNFNIYTYYIMLFLLLVYLYLSLFSFGKFHLKNNYTSISLFTMIGIIFIELNNYGRLRGSWYFNLYFSSFITSTFIMIIFLFVGLRIDKILLFIKGSKLKAISYIFYIFYVLLIISLVLKNGLNFLSVGRSIFSFTSEETSYLYFGDTFILITFLTYSLSEKAMIKNVIILTSIVTSFIIGSRTSLYVYIFVLCLSALKSIINSKCNTKKLVFVGLLLFIITLIFIYNLQIIKNSNNRMFNLIFNKQVDSSFNGRQFYFDKGLEIIKSNWIKGYFYYEYELYGGGYIHNIFAYWSEYGIIIFAMIVVLNVSLLVRSVNIFLKTDNSIKIFMTRTCIFITICSIFSRSYNVQFMWLAIAIGSNLFCKNVSLDKACNNLDKHNNINLF